MLWRARTLRAAGVTVVASAPHGGVIEIRDPAAAAAERGKRAAQRRKTWTGRQVRGQASGDQPLPERSRSERLASVGRVSAQAYAIKELRANKGATGREKDKEDLRQLKVPAARKTPKAR